MTDLTFPNDFLWGVATSAYQIEGGVGMGGRGESIWDRFAATPGKIEDGSDGRIACDHIRLWREDIELLKWLGVSAYRFSIAWPRVIPSGVGVVNENGLGFYDALVDGLLEAGIRPFVTLYHWDLPQALQDRGGWSDRVTASAFAEYAALLSARLGDRVRDWTTHNEPWCIATLGHERGEHAPGHHDPTEALRVSHHVLLSHGMAARAIRRNAPVAEVGIVLNLTPGSPATESEQDLDAAREFDGLFNRWYLDPLLRGQYPQDAIADRVNKGHLAGLELPFVKPGDMDLIATPIDYLGVNYYSRAVVRRGAQGNVESVDRVPKGERTDMGWEVYAQGLEQLLLRLHRDYTLPKVYITENGAAYDDGPDAAGKIADQRRIDYLHDHLAACHRATAQGVPLHGYFAWSFLDNFEWAHGYARRFGLFWVDYPTQGRIPKDSAHWYRDAIIAHGVSVGAQPIVSRRAPRC